MMDTYDFIELCKKVKGYDAIVAVDGNKIHRYCSTFASLRLDREGTAQFKTEYGRLYLPTTTRYVPVGNAKVLYCNIDDLHKCTNTKRILLNAIKDFV